MAVFVAAYFVFGAFRAPEAQAAFYSIEMTELGTHPNATAQSTNNGKNISSVKYFDGKLYTTMVDPTCGGVCPAGYAEYDPSANVWQLKTPVNAVHIYDIISYENNDLWLFGGDNEGAAVWMDPDFDPAGQA